MSKRSGTPVVDFALAFLDLAHPGRERPPRLDEGELRLDGRLFRLGHRDLDGRNRLRALRRENAHPERRHGEVPRTLARHIVLNKREPHVELNLRCTDGVRAVDDPEDEGAVRKLALPKRDRGFRPARQIMAHPVHAVRNGAVGAHELAQARIGGRQRPVPEGNEVLELVVGECERGRLERVGVRTHRAVAARALRVVHSAARPVRERLVALGLRTQVKRRETDGVEVVELDAVGIAARADDGAVRHEPEVAPPVKGVAVQPGARRVPLVLVMGIGNEELRLRGVLLQRGEHLLAERQAYLRAPVEPLAPPLRLQELAPCRESRRIRPHGVKPDPCRAGELADREVVIAQFGIVEPGLEAGRPAAPEAVRDAAEGGILAVAPPHALAELHVRLADGRVRRVRERRERERLVRLAVRRRREHHAVRVRTITPRPAGDCLRRDALDHEVRHHLHAVLRGLAQHHEEEVAVGAVDHLLPVAVLRLRVAVAPRRQDLRFGRLELHHHVGEDGELAEVVAAPGADLPEAVPRLQERTPGVGVRQDLAARLVADEVRPGALVEAEVDLFAAKPELARLVPAVGRRLERRQAVGILQELHGLHRARTVELRAVVALGIDDHDVNDVRVRPEEDVEVAERPARGRVTREHAEAVVVARLAVVGDDSRQPVFVVRDLAAQNVRPSRILHLQGVGVPVVRRIGDIWLFAFLHGTKPLLRMAALDPLVLHAPESLQSHAAIGSVGQGDERGSAALAEEVRAARAFGAVHAIHHDGRADVPRRLGLGRDDRIFPRPVNHVAARVLDDIAPFALVRRGEREAHGLRIRERKSRLLPRRGACRRAVVAPCLKDIVAAFFCRALRDETRRLALGEDGLVCPLDPESGLALGVDPAQTTQAEDDATVGEIHLVVPDPRTPMGVEVNPVPALRQESNDAVFAEEVDALAVGTLRAVEVAAEARARVNVVAPLIVEDLDVVDPDARIAREVAIAHGDLVKSVFRHVEVKRTPSRRPDLKSLVRIKHAVISDGLRRLVRRVEREVGERLSVHLHRAVDPRRAGRVAQGVAHVEGERMASCGELNAVRELDDMASVNHEEVSAPVALGHVEREGVASRRLGRKARPGAEAHAPRMLRRLEKPVGVEGQAVGLVRPEPADALHEAVVVVGAHDPAGGRGRGLSPDRRAAGGHGRREQEARNKETKGTKETQGTKALLLRFSFHSLIFHSIIR